jgi:hypothetical protein
MKVMVISLAILATLSANAQQTITPTDTLKIYGKIKKELFITVSALDTFSKSMIKDQIIYNHKGEIKDTLKNVKGVPLKNILSPIEFDYGKPKELNEFYFVFTATDGYKVVFSWNEIYNAEAGNNFFILTEMDGKRIEKMDQRILFISIADFQTGRRFIKGLEKIEVKRVE